MPFLNDLVEANKEKLNASNTTAQPSEVSKARSIKSRYVLDLDHVKQTLTRQIKGQDHAVNAVVDSLKVIKAGLGKDGKPLLVALLVGPTGVGKTQIVKAITEAIWGEPEAFCRVDMNTLSQEHYAASLTGPPPGYVGSKEGYTILDKEKIQGTFSKPGVVLFDEIEKASTPVIQTLLNVFDNGRMHVASGNDVFDFRNSLIFMSSNIGARNIIRYHNRKRITHRILKMAGLYSDDEERVLSIIRGDLNNRFEPEFMNRIDKIIAFNWLGQNAIHAIAEKELEDLQQRVHQVGADLHYGEDVVAFIARKGFDENYGARAIYRAVQRYVAKPVADAIIGHPPDPDRATVYHARIVGDKLTVEAEV